MWKDHVKANLCFQQIESSGNEPKFTQKACPTPKEFCASSVHDPVSWGVVKASHGRSEHDMVCLYRFQSKCMLASPRGAAVSCGAIKRIDQAHNRWHYAVASQVLVTPQDTTAYQRCGEQTWSGSMLHIFTCIHMYHMSIFWQELWFPPCSRSLMISICLICMHSIHI